MTSRFSLILIIVLAIICPLASRAQQDDKTLRWAGDAQGGAPYEYGDPADPTKIIGFEVDIMNSLAEHMGRKAVFVQNEWSGLIPGLSRNDYSVAMCGQEITPDHEAVVSFTRPYFITGTQLVVGQYNLSITTLADCKGKSIGCLKESTATLILRAQKNINVVSYDDEVNALNDIVNGRLDGALIDAPVATYYASINPKLKIIHDLIGRIDYGGAMRTSDTKLRDEINTGLEAMIKDGELRRILSDWNLWNPLIAAATGQPVEPEGPPNAYNRWETLQTAQLTWTDKFWRYVGFLPMLGQGALITLWLSVVSMIVAVALGMIIALLRMYGPPPVAWLAAVYVEVVRGTPLLIQLFIIFYGLPNIGIKLSPFIAAVMGLGLNYAAYEAENYRAGLTAVPRGQMEAAKALGMRQRDALRYVIVPQAFRMVIPPVTNDFISLLKDSSLVSVITMVELTKVYSQLAQTYFDYLGLGVIVAAIYLLLGLPFVRLANWTEKKFGHDIVSKT
jgi:polar amino acid transport system substrate-binding protein